MHVSLAQASHIPSPQRIRRFLQDRTLHRDSCRSITPLQSLSKLSLQFVSLLKHIFTVACVSLVVVMLITIPVDDSVIIVPFPFPNTMSFVGFISGNGKVFVL
jgi:hypothetical protein